MLRTLPVKNLHCDPFTWQFLRQLILELLSSHRGAKPDPRMISQPRHRSHPPHSHPTPASPRPALLHSTHNPPEPRHPTPCQSWWWAPSIRT